MGARHLLHRRGPLMDNIDFVKLVGQGGIAVAALAVLARIVYRIGERLIAAIDRLGDRVGEHEKSTALSIADVGNQVGDLRQDVAVLSTRVDTVLDFTPVRGIKVPPDTRAYGSRPAGDDEPEDRRPRRDGEYLISRPGRRRGEGDGS